MEDNRTTPLFSGEPIDRIGLGTWRVGGGSIANPSEDARALRALEAALALGYTHIDTAEMYAGGHTETLIRQAMRGADRSKLFITSKVWQDHLKYPQVLNALEGSLERLGTDYLDMYMIHWPESSVPLEETFQALNELAESGRIRYIGVCNFDLPLLKKAQALAKPALAANQVPYSLQNREYAHNGVLRYCQENRILLTAYTPIERGKLLNHPTVRSLAQRHSATPAQVALSWLVRQPEVIAIPMSFNPDHLRENLEAASLELDPAERQQLDSL
jgi:diketogulonate reductase-like aldo/keto reductase